MRFPMHGGDLTPWLIRYGYSLGAFPMTMEDGTVEWFRPETRTLLPISGIHVSRSLKKKINSGAFEIRFDTCFTDVVRSCLRPDNNWISEDFVRVYSLIHHEGWGHCAECWADGELVGGVYGIALGKSFSAESMFHRSTDASKIALWALVERCRELGFHFVDAQLMNPHLRSLGAYEVPFETYQALLTKALAEETQWGPRRSSK